MKTNKPTAAASAAVVKPPPVVKNPLLDSVEEKGYTQPNLQVDPKLLQQPIAEPQFTPPNVDTEEDIFKEDEDPVPDAQSGSAATGKETPEFNKTLNELSPKDQEKSAEHAASVFFAAYQKLHDAGNWYISITDEQIIKLQMEGELDTAVLVPYTSQDWMPLMEFLATYNNQAKDFFKVDPEFRAEVEPALIRVLKKYKIGMTDEQFLMAKFGQDLLVKGIQAKMMRTTSNSILQFAKDESRAARQQQQQPAPALTSVLGGQAAQQPVQEQMQPAQAGAPGGQQAQQGPTSVQDFVREELGTQQNDGQRMAGVERSEPKTFGNKDMLKNLNKVAKRHTVKARSKTSRKASK